MSTPYQWVTMALMLCAGVSAAQAEEYPDAGRETVACYQNGVLIFETQERVREFRPADEMTLLADVSTGQVQETASRLYASNRAGVVCVVVDRK